MGKRASGEDPCKYLSDQYQEASQEKKQTPRSNKCQRQDLQDRIDDIRRMQKASDCRQSSL